MFSRTPGRSRSRRNNSASSTAKKEIPHYDTPLDELTGCLDRIEALVDKTRRNYYEKPVPAKPEAKRLSLFRNRSDSSSRRNSSTDDESQTTTPTQLYGRPPEKNAKFIPMDSADDEEMIELLRRTAELVITGEKSAAAAQTRNEKRRQSRLAEGPDDEQDEDDSPEHIDAHIALFEHFFERNALELIVSIVAGAAFSTPPVETEVSQPVDAKDTEERSATIEKPHLGVSMEGRLDATKDSEVHNDAASSFPCTMLPSLAIATQALQSVSILIQNVSRATSLYFLLSNNYINDLIALPIELYSTAEKNRRVDAQDPVSPPRRFSSAEVAELATHFVTFLKSLAMRMNVETLQFFLSYPGERAGGGSEAASSAHFSTNEDRSPLLRFKGDDIPIKETPADYPVAIETLDVEFPLYARALEFCAAHQDSFVRVTAMNICLNTLRLATVSAGVDGTDSPTPERVQDSSPDGVLHNARPLPLRERLAIAQHVCSPTRVEGLVSPICTKFAQLWGVLEEQFREGETDARKGSVTDLSLEGDEGTKKSRNSKLQKAREEAKGKKLVASFKTTVADLQDELLLLEDVFSVGLTSLNEQIIEMMLATFIYPLLLQPLLQYLQRLPSAREGGPARRLSNAFSGDIVSDASELSGIFGEGVNASRTHESAPAKTALFALASVFHFVTNRPLLRLLLTALLHPLSPNASSETIIRALPDVACTGSNGNVNVRVDSRVLGLTRDEKQTYSFGRVTGRIRSRRNSIGDSSHSKSDACVFVLSSALVEILEGEPGDAALITRSRSNPYRQALLRFFAGGDAMKGLKALTVLLVDSLVTKFDRIFLGGLLFGSGMKTFGDDIPLDERNLDARSAHLHDDRGMGGGSHIDSRRSLARTSTMVGADYLAEIVTALCLGIVNTSPGSGGLWKLEYDEIAAHTLLCAVAENIQALQSASKLLDRRKRQMAAFIAEMPARIAFAGSSPTSQAIPLEGEEAGFGVTFDKLVYESVRKDGVSVLEKLLRPRDSSADDRDHSISVALESTSQDLTERACNIMSPVTSTDDASGFTEEIASAAGAVLGLFRLDALSNLMQELAATGGSILRKRRAAGFSFSSDGTLLDTGMCFERQMSLSVFAPLSRQFLLSVFDADDSARDKGQPAPGSVVGLVGRTAFPCVCEVPETSASLFADGVASVTSEGVKWQSLYLVFLGRYLILAEPEKGGSGGDGRVVTSCKLAQAHVEKDPTPLTTSGSSARRLLISHDGYDKKPPGMFLFDEKPVDSFSGPFVHMKKFRSSLEVWFEDENASDQAFSVLDTKIWKAKSKRGNRLRDTLAQDDRQRYAPS